MLKHLRLSTIGLLVAGLVACSQGTDVSSSQPSSTAETPTSSTLASAPAETADSADLTELFSHIWRVSDSSEPQSTSIYIFLPNGTLLETSCGATYRVATWTVDKATPRLLEVTEDGQVAFTAEIDELTNTALTLQQTLVRSDEKKELVLRAVEEEFVCPDLPR